MNAEGLRGLRILQWFRKVFRHCLLRVLQNVDTEAALFFNEG